jgi:hypothetical protein
MTMMNRLADLITAIGTVVGSNTRPWVGVHPGPGYGGKWHVDAKAWRP